jgi:tRNA1(Val) A37 N6-methylase TrmN6
MSRDRLFLYQPVSGYCYNSDSIFLYQFISKLEPKGSVLDVGCGVGIISLLLSRDFDIQTTIIDKQEFMLEYARYNFAINGLEVSAVQGDFIEWVSEDRFDYIVSNPPFYDSRVTQSQDTSLNIARYAHHLPLESFIKRVKRYLKP